MLLQAQDHTASHSDTKALSLLPSPRVNKPLTHSPDRLSSQHHRPLEATLPSLDILLSDDRGSVRILPFSSRLQTEIDAPTQVKRSITYSFTHMPRHGLADSVQVYISIVAWMDDRARSGISWHQGGSTHTMPPLISTHREVGH